MNIAQQLINQTAVIKSRQKSLVAQKKHLRTSDPEIIMVQQILNKMGHPDYQEEVKDARKVMQNRMTECYQYLKSLHIVNDLDLNKVLKPQ